MRDRAPAYRDLVLHFDALREGGRIEEPSQQRMREESLNALLRTYTQPTRLIAAGAQLAAHSQPALRTGLMAPVWRPAILYVFGE